MMTVSGIAAEGPPAADETRRIAAECVSPQLTAVLGTDTELRFAVTPVIINLCLLKSATKISKISHPTSDFLVNEMLKDCPSKRFGKLSVYYFHEPLFS